MKLKKLLEQKASLQEEMERLLDNVKTEERAMTEEENAKFDELEAKINALTETIAKLEKGRELTTEVPAVEEDKKEDKENVSEKETEKNEERAFANYLRNKVEERAGSNLTMTDNGAVIPTSIAKKIIKEVYDISPILQKATKYNLKGNLEIPYYDEKTSSISMAYATEFTALTSNSGKFTKITLSGYLAGALTLVSKSLINNSDFDIVNFVITAMSEAIARFMEKECIKGTADKVKGLSEIKLSVTTASATAITSDEVIKLKDLVKDIYQNNGMFIMSNATRTALRLLKDSTGKYILNDDVSSAFGTTLLGKDVYVSDNMDEIGAGKDTIFYGDFSGLALKQSEAVNIEVLRERYADQHAVGVIGWVEFDARVEDAQKLAKLTMKSA